MNKRQIYWLCQILGWTLYGFLQIFLYSTAQSPSLEHLLGEVFQVIFYILTTHLLRFILIRNGWLALSLLRLLPRILGITLALGFLNYVFLVVYSYFVGELTSRDFLLITIMLNTFGPMIIYFIWSMIYFTFHYFERYNKSLQYEAVIKEIELNNLRSQLNPHFIFNALNSIRALVDEDPAKSKNAITQLSNILRNSLMVDRKRLVPVEEELETVRDYLELESVRYEERLKTDFDIHPLSNDFLIPPLMIQTLVENGIKHGISTLVSGGKIGIKTAIMDNNLVVHIRNTGQYLNNTNQHLTGYGLNNTRKRLELIYGDQAAFSIRNEDNRTVLTEIVIPKLL